MTKLLDSVRACWSYHAALMGAGLDSIVTEFSHLTAQYFALCSDRSTERTAWLGRIEIAIAELYAVGLQLPLTEPSDQDAPEMPIEDARRLMLEISETLGETPRHYSFVFHPVQVIESVVGGDLAEDLASIYEDLHDGTALLATGGSAEDVIWAWYIGFQIHWGRHALGALQAINDILRSPGALPDYQAP